MLVFKLKGTQEKLTRRETAVLMGWDYSLVIESPNVSRIFVWAKKEGSKKKAPCSTVTLNDKKRASNRHEV
jgi:hypothetical protein